MNSIFKFGFLLSVILSSLQLSAKEYNLQLTNSSIHWVAKKVTGQHDGAIMFTKGQFVVEGNKVKGGTFEVDMNSITSKDIADAGMAQKLIGHLKSDDFFSTAKFPVSSLVVKNVKPVSGDKYLFTCDLTIKGITNPVEFEAEMKLNGKELTARGTMVVNRAKYDIKYRSGSFFSDLGDKMIYDEFTLDFDLKAVQ